MRSVLITGANGQLGIELAQQFKNWRVIALDHKSLDVTNREDVFNAFTTLCPQVVIHSAAWTAVDECELDPNKAFLVNALGTRFVAEAASSIGAYLSYISTDYVFDGETEQAYTEWDRPNPLSVYGSSKLGGEREVIQRATHGWSIVRTSWLCGFYGPNIVKTVLSLIEARPKLEFVDDQFGSPTFVQDLAPKIEKITSNKLSGIYHITNQGVASWYEFARAIVQLKGQDPSRIQAIATKDLEPPRLARRPRRSVLDNTVLRLSGEDLLPQWQNSLDKLVKKILNS